MLKSNMFEVSDRWNIETIRLKYTIDEHILQLYLITNNIYNENICCEDIQCRLNIQRNNQPEQHSEWNFIFCKCELMTMTIDDSNRLCVHRYIIQMMRICESSVVRWKSRWLKTNLFLIYFKDWKNCRKIKRIYIIRVFVSLKSVEVDSIHKLKLFTNVFSNDEVNQNFFQYILCKRDFWMKHCRRFNYTKSNARIFKLFWLFWYDCRRYMIQPNCWLRMKSWFVFAVKQNKTHCAYVRRSEFNHSEQQHWKHCEWLHTCKKLMNYSNLYWRRFNFTILKKNEIRKQYKFE